MKASLNWIRTINKRYQCAADPMPNGIDVLVEKIGAQLGAVEEVINVGKKYEGIVVAKVVSCQKHPNADKLTICFIDDGKAVKNVKRDKSGLVQVVHGAKNVEVGQLVAWIPPGVTVPCTYDKEPLVLESRNLRGMVSHGMLASAKELDLGDDHEGILVIDQPARPGQPFAEVYGLDDYVIDIENKMFTHRPDCFGMLGIARELAGIQGHVFRSPAWYVEKPALPKPSGVATHKLIIQNKIPKLVPRFSVVVIKDVKVGPSPLWLQARLNSVGIKSINNVVDVTNFMMFETAQPLHAYDYDRLSAGSIEVRQAKVDEALTLLGGKKINLNKEDIVIASGGKTIGLGGVMGGVDAATEVNTNTKTIAIEVANFDMNTIRRTAMSHGLFTEAATRFTKHQSPRQTLAVLVKAIDEIKKIAGGRQASPVIDSKHFPERTHVVKLSAEFVNQRLGLKLSAHQVKKLLENVEFKVTVSSSQLKVEVPFWRTDIAIAEDIVEEVGRLFGYDHLPLVLPKRDLSAAPTNQLISLKNRLRQIMQQAGANELLTYSFVDASLLKKVGQQPKNSYHIRNASSPELQYYRQTLTSSLLEKVHPNIKAGFEEFAIYELGVGHYKGVLDREKLPLELPQLALVVAAKADKVGVPYYLARKLCEHFLRGIGFIEIAFRVPQAKTLHPALSYYELERSANIFANGRMVGRIGEYTAETRANLKLPSYCAGFEFYLPQIDVPLGTTYQPLNRFPSLEQDFCLRSAAKSTYVELEIFMRRQLNVAAGKHGISYNLWPIDIFQKPSDKQHKQTTWRINFWQPERTLTTKEVNQLLDIIAEAAKTKLKAERV